jgi:N-methylhydantoinase A
VTDAHLLLGRLPADARLAGRVPLNAERVRSEFDLLARRIGCTPERAAMGVLSVANAGMSRALGHISLQRGHDPADFALLSFGGAGGLHACELAGLLGMRTVIVPRFPGAFSALGLAVADVRREAAQALPAGIRIDTAEPAVSHALTHTFQALYQQITREMATEGFIIGEWQAERRLELRYIGQSFSLSVSVDSTLDLAHACNRFHTAHRVRYGHADPAQPVEVTAAHLVAIGRNTRPAPRVRALHRTASEPYFTLVYEANGWLPATVLTRDALPPGRAGVDGPCIIVQDDATTYVPLGWTAVTDAHHNLVIRRGE